MKYKIWLDEWFRNYIQPSSKKKTCERYSEIIEKHLKIKLWMPYESLVFRYPNLKGKRILQPFYEIKRWFSLFKRSVWKRSVGELKTNAAMNKKPSTRLKN